VLICLGMGGGFWWFCSERCVSAWRQHGHDKLNDDDDERDSDYVAMGDDDLSASFQLIRTPHGSLVNGHGSNQLESLDESTAYF